MISPTSSNEEMNEQQRYELARTNILLAARKLREAALSFPSTEQLPWRKVRTPYRIFLAELLLILTCSDVVARLFEEIALHYPDVKSLANANQEELAAILEPLGLKKRAPFFPKAVQ
jgi:adenine-specific DNA glycosylase